MPVDTDPFRYQPYWRDKIADPNGSRFRKMSLASIDQKMIAAGFDKNWRLTDEQREANRVDTLNSGPGGDLWVIGCGSLIWDPGFLFDEVRLGAVTGFERRFCLYSVLGRGSPDKPGLMVAFDPGTTAQGAVFRIPRDKIEHESRLIWRREMLVGAYQPRFVSVTTAQGPLQALAFVANPASSVYRPEIGAEEAACLVATGEGFYGTCFEYVESLARQLAALGIHDHGVVALYESALSKRRSPSIE
ncbi:MAG: gamma-glutamylcyclotransferase [Burkholderiaceae bacterium]